MEKRWINPKEFEEEFGIKVRTQSKMRKDEQLPFSKIGGFIFYDRNKIDAWLESNSIVN